MSNPWCFGGLNGKTKNINKLSKYNGLRRIWNKFGNGLFRIRK